MPHTVQNWSVWKPEINAYIQDELEKQPKSLYNEIFTVETTNKLQVNDKGYSDYGPMEEVAELGDAIDDEMLEGYGFSYNRRSFRKKATFSSDWLETGMHSQVESRARAFVRTIEYSRNLYIFSMFRRAFDTSLTYGDSKPLVSTLHPRKDGGGNQCNTFADGVQDALSYDNVLALQDVLLNTVSNSGNLMDLGSSDRNVVLWCTHANRELAFQIAGVEADDKKPGTADNDANYFKKGAKFDVLVLPFVRFEAASLMGETTTTKTNAANYYDSMWGLMDKEMVKKNFKVYVAEGYAKFDEEIKKSNQGLIKYAYDKYAYGTSNWMGFVASKGDGSTYSS